MAKSKTSSSLIFGILAVLGIVLLRKPKDNSTDNSGGGGQNPIDPPAPTYSYPIVYNKYHPDAKLLQAAVGVTQDGYIGPVSITAINKYGFGFTTSFSIGSRNDLNAILSKINAIKNPPPPATVARPQQLYNLAKQGHNLKFIRKSKSQSGYLDAGGAFQVDNSDWLDTLINTYSQGYTIPAKSVIAYGSKSIFWKDGNKTIMSTADDLTAV